ncbi:MAG: hypothetical protein CL678_07575 [Bdellovibrionaceae bacterium]|nr:hypothetical protein [Pseudobdellovibrionaceae bacterium]
MILIRGPHEPARVAGGALDARAGGPHDVAVIFVRNHRGAPARHDPPVIARLRKEHPVDNAFGQKPFKRVALAGRQRDHELGHRLGKLFLGHRAHGGQPRRERVGLQQPARHLGVGGLVFKIAVHQVAQPPVVLFNRVGDAYIWQPRRNHEPHTQHPAMAASTTLLLIHLLLSLLALHYFSLTFNEKVPTKSALSIVAAALPLVVPVWTEAPTAATAVATAFVAGWAAALHFTRLRQFTTVAAGTLVAGVLGTWLISHAVDNKPGLGTVLIVAGVSVACCVLAVGSNH